MMLCLAGRGSGLFIYTFDGAEGPHGDKFLFLSRGARTNREKGMTAPRYMLDVCMTTLITLNPYLESGHPYVHKAGNR